MAQITIEELFWGKEYAIHDKANMAYAKRLSQGKMKAPLAGLMMEYIRQTLIAADKEIPKLKDQINSVQLCFTTDPFMQGYPEVTDMSLKIIRKLNDAGIKCTALTKGILPIELANISPENEYGITLVSLDEECHNRFEPNTAPFQDRIWALRALHDAGCYTWVSIEPYPTPNIIEQNLDDVLDAVGFVDKIIFGRMHYNKDITAYKEHKEFFNNCANQVIRFCKTKDIAYHIKKGTISKE